ncbi:uncharacterized protein LOC100327241 [Bombyx mori]|nr:uncharacterized protein LOC100327241 [Bombyx mori]ADA67929.1 hypothetical protein [Bombyx mori]
MIQEILQLPIVDKTQKSLTIDQALNESGDDDTRDILEKIKAINDGLRKPIRRQQINWNPPLTESTQALNKEILEKLQQIIASGKLNGVPNPDKEQDEPSESLNDLRYSKQINLFPRNRIAPAMTVPYLTNMPVLIIPSLYGGLPNGELSDTDLQQAYYQTRQSPTPSSPSPFQFQWPFASFFPVLIRDPFISILNGGGWNSFIEYGQNADVCTRKQKAAEKDILLQDNVLENEETLNDNKFKLIDRLNSREGRAIKKRTIPHGSGHQVIEDTKFMKISRTKPTTTQRPFQITKLDHKTKTSTSEEGDLRFPFGDFTWFGNKKPVAPSPGFFINRLKVRRGGVAIAGPGGVATAGKGGTAIVGPGGLAYTQPGGLAVAGPDARVVALSSEADLTSIVSRLQQQKQNGRGGENQRNGRRYEGFDRGSDEYRYNGVTFEKSPRKMEYNDFMIFLKPIAHAVSSKGVAIANPISEVVIARNKTGSIVHTPVAAAVVGPGGVAHAQLVQYIPFYGGAKGQYLEIKKNNLGNITSESIVSQDKISSDVAENNEENLLSKLFKKNLQSLRSTSGTLIKLHNLGKKTGSLSNTEKERFKTQLSSLEETVSNIIKLIEDIGDDVDVLFKKANSLRRTEDQYVDDEAGEGDVSEEGISIEASAEPVNEYEKEIVAEAKPVGLAVIGEHGLAASRPVGTAVALKGIAIARPIGTAIAGIDPSVLGINFQINHLARSKGY